MTALPNRLPEHPVLQPDVLGALPPPEPDVLSDVLRTVRLSGAMLFLVEATVPWRSQAPHARTFAPHVMPQAQHLVSYHIVVRGQFDLFGSFADIVDVNSRFAVGLVLTFGAR